MNAGGIQTYHMGTPTNQQRSTYQHTPDLTSRLARLEKDNEDLRWENALLKEALEIKNELEALRQSQKRSRARIRSSRSRLVTPSSHQDTVTPIVVSKHRSDPDWYESADVSVSSTGSDIRRRLQDGLDHRTVLPPASPFEDVSRMLYGDKASRPGMIPTILNEAREFSTKVLNTPTGDLSVLQDEPTTLTYIANERSHDNHHTFQFNQTAPPSLPINPRPAWITQNPHLSSLFNPEQLQLPPLFRSPITSPSPLTSWAIPPPVLFGLGNSRHATSN